MYDTVIEITPTDESSRQVFMESFYGNKSVYIGFNQTGGRCSLFARKRDGSYNLFSCNTTQYSKKLDFINTCATIGSDRKGEYLRIIKVPLTATSSAENVQLTCAKKYSLAFRKPPP
jgi:hypothetical protein